MSVEAQQERPHDLDTGDGVATPGTPVMRRIEHHLWRNLSSGFWVLVPLVITFVIFRFAFVEIDGVVRPFVSNISLLGFSFDFRGVGVIVTLLVFYAVGASLAVVKLQRWQDAVLTRIPIIKGPYSIAREVSSALSTPLGHHYSRVVFLEWPRPGVKAMGFVTGHLGGVGGEEGTKVAVYIPTVPNPTSGMLAFVSEEDIIESNITVQQAMKTVLSGGIVLPDALDFPIPSLQGIPEPDDRSQQ